MQKVAKAFEAPHCLGVKPNRRFEIATSITELIAQRYYEEDLRNVIPNAAPRPDLHTSSVSCHSTGSSCGVQQIKTQTVTTSEKVFDTHCQAEKQGVRNYNL